jgi:hypothetical protein
MNATMYILCCLLIVAGGDTGKLIKFLINYFLSVIILTIYV